MNRRSHSLYLSLAGAAIGFAAAFLGIGGGILIVPLLMVGFGLPQRRAAGTSLGIVTFVVCAAIAMDVVQGTKETRPAILAALLVAPAAMFASRRVTPWIHHVPTHVLRRVFALVLVVAAFKLFGLPPFGGSGGGPSGWFAYEEHALPALVLLPCIGLCIGGISTLVGIGGGLILIPALGLLFHDLTWLQCRSTSLLVVAPTAFIGFSRHLAQGTADASLVRPLVPAAIVGSLGGAFVAHRVDTLVFGYVFGAFLLVVAGRLFLASVREDD